MKFLDKLILCLFSAIILMLSVFSCFVIFGWADATTIFVMVTNVLKNKVEIINYIEVSHFDNNKVIIKYIDGDIVIKGDNLIISKLMNDSILVKGSISNIELR